MKGILMTRENAEKTAKGLKTQTRRTAGLERVNVEPSYWTTRKLGNNEWAFYGMDHVTLYCKPRYLPGETVYLKEGWKIYDLDTQTINNR